MAQTPSPVTVCVGAKRGDSQHPAAGQERRAGACPHRQPLRQHRVPQLQGGRQEGPLCHGEKHEHQRSGHHLVQGEAVHEISCVTLCLLAH